MNITNLSSNGFSARFFAVLTAVSMILTAFPAAFFVAEAANTDADGNVTMAFTPAPTGGDTEYVDISFFGSGTLNLEDWTLEDETQLRHTFGAVTLASGDYYRVCGIGSAAGCDVAIDSGGNAVWNNSGDTATLKDESGVVVVDVTFGGVSSPNDYTYQDSGSVDYTTTGPVENTDDGLFFATIQEAIDAATTDDGETIKVSAGTYNEDVQIDKEITLQGAGAGSTFINGQSGSYTIELKGSIDNVTITGFTVTGSAGQEALKIEQGSDNDNILVENNVFIAGDGGHAVYAGGITNSDFNHNTFQSAAGQEPTILVYIAGSGEQVNFDGNIFTGDLGAHLAFGSVATDSIFKNNDFTAITAVGKNKLVEFNNPPADSSAGGNQYPQGQNWMAINPASQWFKGVFRGDKVDENTTSDDQAVSVDQDNNENQGTITVCKVYLDAQGDVFDPVWTESDATFTVPGTTDVPFTPVKDPKATDGISFATFDGLNTDLDGDQNGDAYCVETDYDLGYSYLYGAEEMTGPDAGDWSVVGYNDQFNTAFDLTDPISGLTDADNDGEIVLAENANDPAAGENTARQLFVVNQFTPAEPTADIVATKIVCEDESQLPNGDIGSIDQNTAIDWVEDHNTCSLKSDWQFQWALGGVSAKDAPDNSGELAGPWTTSAPTDASGQTTIALTNGMLDGENRISIREVMDTDNYLPFTGQDDTDNVSAELYCTGDASHYDNLEWIKNVEVDQEYNCVAWNVPTEVDPDPNDENQFTFTGYKFHNRNGDRSNQSSYGVIDPNEERLYDWDFNMYKEVDGQWEFVASTTINPANAPQNAGKFVFPQQYEAGTYHVCEVAQPGWTQVRQSWSGTPYHIVTDNQSPNMANEGPYCATSVYTDEADRSKAAYFGNQHNDPNDEHHLNISGTVYLDYAADDCDNRTECKFNKPGVNLQGWEMRLYEEDSNGDWQEIATSTSNTNGRYGFPMLHRAGEFHTCEVLKPGYEQSEGNWSGSGYLVNTPNQSGMTDEGPYCNTISFDDSGDRSSKSKFGNARTSSTVTMCKYDEFENALPGWQLALVGETVDSLPVDPDGSTQAMTGVAAGDYVLKAEGTYEYRGNTGLLADARFSERKVGDVGYGTYPNNPWRITSATGGLSVQVNNDQGVVWGSTYSPNHEYYGAHTQSTAGPINFHVGDNIHRDNVGAIDVTLANGRTGVTGETGCVTFEDVPYGEYEVEELMQTGWVNQSGLGPVTVDEPTTQINVFNRDTRETPVATVTAQKIVCTDETQLPNWNTGSDYRTGGPDITVNTAANWVAEYDSCEFATDWQFEWASGDDVNKDGNPDNDVPSNPLYGPAGGDWTTTGATDSTGAVQFTVSDDEIGENGRIWVREVLQDGYIPFTRGGGLNQSNDDNETAELYCHTDVRNYDNFDMVDGITVGEDYNCVAWNVPDEPEVATCELPIYSNDGTLVTDTNKFATSTYEHDTWTDDIAGAQWVWATDYVENPTQDETYTFAETFTVDNPSSAQLQVAADNLLVVTVNGTEVLNRTNQNNYVSPHTVDILSALNPTGENTIKFEVTNEAGDDSALSNPAGVLYRLDIVGDAESCAVTTEPDNTDDGENGGNGGDGNNGGDNDDVPPMCTAGVEVQIPEIGFEHTAVREIQLDSDVKNDGDSFDAFGTGDQAADNSTAEGNVRFERTNDGFKLYFRGNQPTTDESDTSQFQATFTYDDVDFSNVGYTDLAGAPLENGQTGGSSFEDIVDIDPIAGTITINWALNTGNDGIHVTGLEQSCDEIDDDGNGSGDGSGGNGGNGGDGNDEDEGVDEEEPNNFGTGGGGGATRLREPAEPTVAGISDSADENFPLVQGDQVSVVPTGAPNTGAGGTSPSAPNYLAIVSLMALMLLVGTRRKNEA